MNEDFKVLEGEEVTEPVTEEPTESETPIEEPVEEPEVPVEPEPEPPSAPLAPTNLIATVNDDVVGVTLEWQAEAQTGVVFKIYLNDVFTGALSSDNKIKLADLIAGETYKANIKAINTETMLESEFSNEVYFEVKGLIGSNDPANWIGVRLDNITVIYQK